MKQFTLILLLFQFGCSSNSSLIKNLSDSINSDIAENITNSINIDNSSSKYRIAFIKKKSDSFAGDIFSVNQNGQKLKRLTKYKESGEYGELSYIVSSKDFKNIYFTNTSRKGIFKLDIKSQSIDKLVKDPNNLEEDFRLDPFDVSKDGLKFIGSNTNSDVVIFDTKNKSETSISKGTEGSAYSTVYSNKTNKIAYIKNNKIIISDDNGKNELIIEDPVIVISDKLEFSNDDKFLFYTSNGDIYKLNIDTSKSENVTNSEEFEYDFSISPDNKNIVTQNENGLSILDLQTKENLPLTKNSKEEQDINPIFILDEVN